VQTGSRNVSKLIIAGVVVSLSFVGWVARGSLAQDPVPVPQTLPDPGASVPPSIRVPKDTSPQGAAGTTAEPGLSSTDSPPQLTVPTLPAAQSDFAITRKSSANPTPSPPPTAVDDPEKAAQAFVQENEKLAELQLKALKDEADKLRARLRKVEAGIKRWQSLKEALQRSQAATGTEAKSAVIPGVVVPGAANHSGVEAAPTDLDPISATPSRTTDPRLPSERPKSL